MTDADRLAAADRAQAALDYLAPAFDTVEAAYTAKLTEIAAEQPWETGKISKLAMALKISRSVRAQIEAQAADRNVVEAEQKYAKQISSLSDHRRFTIGR